ncbi:fimbrillin family protein [Niabella hirudinis]|uniref:fimbrillin family protein n=1 Tax=Niabella hirudinis TaxID=1285929 RepID=UPI003EBB7A4B
MSFKAKILLPVLFLWMALASSCKKDDPTKWEPATPVTPTGKAELFTSVFAKTAISRVDTAGWLPGNNVGITMLKLSDSAVVAGNKKYSPAADGSLTSQPGELISYPANGTLVNFVAYYPFQAGADSVYKVDLNSQEDLNALDLIYAATVTNFNVESHTVPHLKFEHQLAKVVLNIARSPRQRASFKDLEITIKNIATAADFNLKTGNFDNIVNADFKPAITPVYKTTDAGQPDTSYTVAFLVIPERIEGKLVEVKLNSGRVLEWAFPAGTAIAKGKTVTANAVVGDPVERLIFAEGFGTASVSANPSFNNYTGYDNGAGLTITGNGQVRSSGNGFTSNNARFANTEQNLKIENINTDGYSDLKLQFRIGSTNASATVPVDLKELVSISYNGVTGLEGQIPSTISYSSNAAGIYTFEIDLGALPASATGTLEIIGNKGYTSSAPKSNAFFRLDDVKLLGAK